MLYFEPSVRPGMLGRMMLSGLLRSPSRRVVSSPPSRGRCTARSSHAVSGPYMNRSSQAFAKMAPA
eukprot:2856775-Alexandrium_andersonii.AAC.1